MQLQASIPSPSTSVWHLGPLPIRAYALCIVAGIIVAILLTNRRFTARGAGPEDVWDVAKWAVPFGILGGRIYHVITDPELYFGSGAHPIDAVKIWDGGLGIPGAILLGTLGAWIGCRRRGLRLDSFGDAAVPGVALAQALGRWGNYFNNELFGRPTGVPWKLEIHCWDIVEGHAVSCGNPASGTTTNVMGYYQPTFLYESLWNIALAVFLIWAGRRFALGNGRVFALYAAGYGLGRLWVEALRSDHANHILGLRVNIWTALIAIVGGVIWFLTHRGPREASIYRDGRPNHAEPAPTQPAVGPEDERQDGHGMEPVSTDRQARSGATAVTTTTPSDAAGRSVE